MIHIPIVASSVKLWVMCAFVIPFFGTIAVTEAFQGQLIIALIAALPPTGAVIVALVALMRGQAVQQKNQAEMARALDGKLDKLMEAEKKVSKSEGAEQERVEERDRVSIKSDTIEKVEIVQPETNPVPTITVTKK